MRRTAVTLPGGGYALPDLQFDAIWFSLLWERSRVMVKTACLNISEMIMMKNVNQLALYHAGI